MKIMVKLFVKSDEHLELNEPKISIKSKTEVTNKTAPIHITIKLLNTYNE